MTIMEAAIKWGLSPNWVRELITSKRVPAKLVKVGPVPYYDIPDNTSKPQSMQRAPARKGTEKKLKPESIARRAYRAEKVRIAAQLAAETAQRRAARKRAAAARKRAATSPLSAKKKAR